MAVTTPLELLVQAATHGEAPSESSPGAGTGVDCTPPELAAPPWKRKTLPEASPKAASFMPCTTANGS